MNATTQVLLADGYRSTDEVFRGWPLMTAMSKLEQYRAECESLAKKHGRTLTEFERAIHAVKRREDFGAEDDLQDWEFAAQALTWWQAKIVEVRMEARLSGLKYCLPAQPVSTGLHLLIRRVSTLGGRA